jgi:hypothetical protein
MQTLRKKRIGVANKNMERSVLTLITKVEEGCKYYFKALHPLHYEDSCASVKICCPHFEPRAV